MNSGTDVVYRSKPWNAELAARADPVVTELLRNALNSAADQMKRALVRTSYSPIIYESFDFSTALYDSQVRLLAQAPTQPLFMGTLNFCIESALANVGGVARLRPGDVLIYNWPYGSGSHAQDCSIIAPVFAATGEHVGFAATKAHWMDIAAKDPYCTDTRDVFQEGVFYPGVKLFREGEPNEDVMQMIRANSRLPEAVLGDVNAQAAACRVGARELLRVFARFGSEKFNCAVERMYQHGEQSMRGFIEQIPDGVYRASGALDSSGVTDEQIRFDWELRIAGSEVDADFTSICAQVDGPMNCPHPTTVAATYLVFAALSRSMSHLNEGCFRPIRITTRPGTLYHPMPPAPCYLYGWATNPLIEGSMRALSAGNPELVAARSGACVLTLIWWGRSNSSGRVWMAGSPLPIGNGASSESDGMTGLNIGMAFGQIPPLELWEAKFPWLIERCEQAADSAGAGQHAGGPGIDIHWRVLEDCTLTSTIEQTRSEPWGLLGGNGGRRNSAELVFPDGHRESFSKVTSKHIPAGTLVIVRSGGGGGYGEPRLRPAEKVQRDLRDGYVTAAFAARHYSHAV